MIPKPNPEVRSRIGVELVRRQSVHVVGPSTMPFRIGDAVPMIVNAEAKQYSPAAEMRAVVWFTFLGVARE